MTTSLLFLKHFTEPKFNWEKVYKQGTQKQSTIAFSNGSLNICHQTNKTSGLLEIIVIAIAMEIRTVRIAQSTQRNTNLPVLKQAFVPLYSVKLILFETNTNSSTHK